ncbi:Rib/alpha-like domain-containing protein [Corynebacterium wankanglinii]|uniref:Long Rib domain-containing protein n=1 Tax=Corynebacterium wankanglinii TaxID=2735136 RepID=A0A838CJL6_9CORY|nr:Rib/alpha-like domain-containing protein [Corynebacterium wankanglinii]MBA1834903.1 hypothetical protein [Corynebacterium wankanglinii]
MKTTRLVAAALTAALATTTVVPASAADFMSRTYNPGYADAQTTPGNAVRIPVSGAFPAGTTFSVNDTAGWGFAVDASGTVTATPRGQYPGAWAQNYVTITYPDHTVDYALFTVRVVAPSVSLAESLDLSWGDATVAPGGSVTLRPSVSLPAGSQLAAPTGSGGWRVEADQASGEVTVSAPAGARAGAGLGITLGVAFPDGSTKQYTSRITVGKEPSLSTSSAPKTTPKPAPAPAVGELSYPDTAVSANERVTVFLNGSLPEGARVIGPNQQYNGWSLHTDEETGAITFAAPRNAQPGYALVLEVAVLLPDGSTRDLTAKAYVPSSAEGATPGSSTQTTTPKPNTSTTAPKPAPTTRSTPARPAAETANVSIADTTITAGESIVVTPEGLPEGARVFVTEETRGGWTIAREGETGIRVAAARGMRPGSVLRINAAIQFADYSSVNRVFTVKVVRGTATGGLTTAPAPTTTAPAPAPGNAASPAGVITGLALALGLLGTIGLVGRFFPFF